MRNSPSLSLSEPLLTCWAGTDDGTIQRSTWFKSTNHDSSDYDEGSEESDDINSLSDIVTARGSPGSEESELSSKEIAESKEKSDVPEPIEIQVDIPSLQEEDF